MTENGRKISTAGRKMSVGCEGEKVSTFAITHVFCRNINIRFMWATYYKHDCATNLAPLLNTGAHKYSVL
jgi:hypothetical protein